ncbi:WGR domain-containing protein (plasmid) [Microvirga sp. RSM25]|uniref:WGR domain-containing protein n=1 Tax=Microvirga sp. RSM25 TaxID=3273802 RepID=UPI00384F8FA8
MNEIFLTRRDPGRNIARLSVMRLEPDLFGSIVLVREWGRIGGASRALRRPYATAEAAGKACAVVRRGKIRRGYQEAGSCS